MPQINLLNPGSGGKKESAQGFDLKDVKNPKLQFEEISKQLILFSAIAFGCMLFIFIVVSIFNFSKTSRLRGLEKKIKNLKIDPTEMEKMREERRALEKKVNLVDILSSRQFYYYEKMVLIPDLIPWGVWINSMKTQERVPAQGVTTRRSRREQTEEKLPSRKTLLLISGTAVAGKIDDAVALVGEFIDNLKKDEKFSESFAEIKLENIVKGSMGSRDVMNFDLVCETK